MSSAGHLSELESLRSQVADLTRALTERDQSMQAQRHHLEETMQDLCEQSHLLRTITEGTAAEAGEEFFASLVTQLTCSLNVQYAIVGEVVGEQTKTVRTLAVSSGGQLVDNFEYGLVQTPCETALERTFACYERGVQDQFPRFTRLAELGVEGYCGIPLRTKAGLVNGLLVVMDTKPLRNTERLKSLMTVFASRAGAELQRQQTEAVHRESEARLRFTQFAVDHAEDGVLWADDSKRFIYANEAACRLLGYSNEELLTLSISDIAPYHDPTRFQQRIDQIKQGTAATYESIHRRKDGTEFPIEASVTYLEHEGRGYSCGIVRDITERKHIEYERLQALLDLQNIMETAPDIMFTLDRQGNMVSWNRRVKDVTGYSQEELLNKPALSFVPPEEQPRTAAAIQRAFTEGYAELEGHLLTKEQRLIPYHWTGALLTSPQGEPIGITGIGRDVSDKKRVEEALRKSEQRFALAVEGSSDILWDAHRLPGEPWYAPQTPIWWSPRVREWLSLEEAEPFETLEQWAARLHSDDKDRVFGQLAAHVEQRVPYDVEYRLCTNRGDYRWVRGRGQAIWDEQGEIRRMSGSCQDITDRKRAQETLWQSRALLQSFVEHTPAAIAMLDRDLKYIAVSKRWYQDYRLGDHDIIGLHHYDVFPEIQKMEHWQAIHRRCLAGEVMRNNEDRLVREDGKEDWLRWEIRPWTDAAGSIGGIIMFTEVITERKQAREALRASEERWQLAVRGSNDGIWDWDIQAGKVYFSPRWKAMRGFEDHEIVNLVEEWRSRIHPDDLDRVLQRLDTYLAKQIPEFCEEYRVQRKDGTYIWILDRGVALWAENGTPLRMAGSESDITEHRQTLLRLAEQESLLRAILDAEPECVNRVAADGTILQMNKAGLCFIESDSFEQVVGRSAYGLVAPEFLERYRDMHQAVIQGASQRLEFQIVGLKGTRRWMETHAVPLRNPVDHRVEHLAITRDITERKRAEKALCESEERYRTLVDLSPNGVLVYSNGEKRYVNQTACTILGAASPEQLLDNPTFHVSHPDAYGSVHASIAQILATGEPVRRVERKYQRLDGTAISVEVDAGRIMWDGEPAVQVIFADITDRKQAEDALRESEAFNISVLNSLSTQIAVLNSQGIIMAVNKPWQQFAEENGSPHLVESFVGMNYLNVCAQAPLFANGVEAASAQAGILAVLAGTQNEFYLEYPCHSPDKQRWFRMHVTPLRDSQVGVVVAHENITARKQAEEALRLSEERFNLAVRGSNTGIWDWDLRTNKTYFSPLWKSMLGYEEYELQGELFEWERRLHPDDCERSSATVRVYLNGTTPQYELEHRLRHKDGSYRWILARGVSISDAEGKPYRMAGSHIDITEQKQTQEALVQSERQLRTVLDALPVGVWFTDPSGKPVLANPAAKRIWSGIKQIRIGNAPNTPGWWEAVGSSDELHRWALSHALTKGVPSLNETLDLECLDGTMKIIRNTTVPVQDEAGVVLGAIVLNEDITALRQAQEALKLTQFSVDHAVEGFFWIGSDARLLNVNEAACRMLEYTRDELTTMTLHDIDTNISPERWSAHWEELKQKGSLTFVSKYWSSTGRVLDAEVTVNYLQYEGREYNCAIMRDIGERKRADEVLRSSEERFTKAFRASSHLIGITEIHTGHCIDVNDACLELFGYRREEVIGQSTVTLGLWPRQEDRDRLIETIRADGMVRNLEQSFITKNGEMRQLVISSDPVQINGISCLLTVGHDVTERKRMEEVLRQREHDLRAAVEERERISQDLHDGILQSLFAVGLGLEASKLTMSPRIRKTSGPPLDQAIGQLNRVMQEIRNFIAGLGSELLQGKDLPAALQHMLTSMTQNQATRVRLAVEDRAAQAVSAKQALHLFLVIQEAVSNCIRHGRAPEARVSLKMLKQGVRLSIRDNGRGFNPKAAKGTGHGLRNMAARAQKIGGRFTVLSKVNEGTRIVLDLPARPGA